MEWIETWSGGLLPPLDPKFGPIRVVDVAMGLSNKCRYNGQSRFYTVAEHSILLAKWCLRQDYGRLVAMHALLHDAAEAFLPDVPTPIKPLFPEFRKCENQLHRVILEALRIAPIHPQGARWIKNADSRIVLNERAAVMPNHKAENRWLMEDLEPLKGITIRRWVPDQALHQFIKMYHFLKGSAPEHCGHPFEKFIKNDRRTICSACGSVIRVT